MGTQWNIAEGTQWNSAEGTTRNSTEGTQWDRAEGTKWNSAEGQAGSVCSHLSNRTRQRVRNKDGYWSKDLRRSAEFFRLMIYTRSLSKFEP